MRSSSLVSARSTTEQFASKTQTLSFGSGVHRTRFRRSKRMQDVVHSGLCSAWPYLLHAPQGAELISLYQLSSRSQTVP